MLETIRQAAQTWLAKLILVVISVPFALWGIESYVRNPTGKDAVATVGSESISSAEFNEAVRRQLDQFKQQFGGQIDASIMDNPEMRKSILDQLIDQRLFAAASQTAGVKVSDAALRDRIAGEPTFQDNGQFSQARYATYLQASGNSAQSFENALRKDLERQQFASSIANTGIVAKTSVEGFIKASEQAREIAMVNITPEQFTDKVKITPEQIKADYDQNQAAYTIPEMARAEYVELSAEALTPTVQVPAEEIKTFYEANSARFVQKEERKASHILINAAKDAKDEAKAAAKAKADELYAQVKKNPKLFAELAKKNSQDTGSAASGGDLGFFGKGMMVKPFEEAAFKAAKGDIVGPVLSDFGYHVIMVTDVRPEKGKSLADATPEIDGELKKQKAQRKFTELAEKFATAAYEQSASLKAAADVAGLAVKQSPWVSKGQTGVPPFTNQKLLTALFSDEVMKNKRNSEAVETAPNNLIVARVLESKPASVRPLTEVEKTISAKLTRAEAGKLAKADGEAKLAALKAGKAVDLKWPALLAVSRTNPGGLPPPVIETAMKIEAKTLPAFAGAENPAGGYSLIQVAKVIEAPATDEAKVKAARSRLSQTLAQQEMMGVLSLARAQTSVAITKDALEKKDK
jgi:peptidyl-prolyl cis-trans isomerase D